VIVERAALEPFTERLVRRAREWRLGDPLDPETKVGPLASEAQLERVSRYLDVARRDGATALAGGGRAEIDDILRALVGPTLRGCLGLERERSTAARFMIRASIESVPPIRRIKNREIDHLRKFAAAMRRALPGRADAELYWGLHFALAMAHHTTRDSERLTKLSEGKCDLDDVESVIARVVSVAVMALMGSAVKNTESETVAARRARAT